MSRGSKLTINSLGAQSTLSTEHLGAYYSLAGLDYYYITELLE